MRCPVIASLHWIGLGSELLQFADSHMLWHCYGSDVQIHQLNSHHSFLWIYSIVSRFPTKVLFLDLMWLTLTWHIPSFWHSSGHECGSAHIWQLPKLRFQTTGSFPFSLQNKLEVTRCTWKWSLQEQCSWQSFMWQLSTHLTSWHLWTVWTQDVPKIQTPPLQASALHFSPHTCCEVSQRRLPSWQITLVHAPAQVGDLDHIQGSSNMGNHLTITGSFVSCRLCTSYLVLNIAVIAVACAFVLNSIVVIAIILSRTQTNQFTGRAW